MDVVNVGLGQQTLSQLLPSIAALVAIVITTIVAIYAIKRTARENRLTITHDRMTSCLIDTVSMLNKMQLKINSIWNVLTTEKWREDKELEEKYLDELKQLNSIMSGEYFDLLPRQALFFPEKNVLKHLRALYRDLFNDVLPKLHEISKKGRVEEREAEDVQDQLRGFESKIRGLINLGRDLIGPEKLEPITETFQFNVAQTEKGWNEDSNRKQ